jgi:hypothetical protein
VLGHSSHPFFTTPPCSSSFWRSRGLQGSARRLVRTTEYLKRVEGDAHVGFGVVLLGVIFAPFLRGSFLHPVTYTVQIRVVHLLAALRNKKLLNTSSRSKYLSRGFHAHRLPVEMLRVTVSRSSRDRSRALLRMLDPGSLLLGSALPPTHDIEREHGRPTSRAPHLASRPDSPVFLVTGRSVIPAQLNA